MTNQDSAARAAFLEITDQYFRTAAFQPSLAASAYSDLGVALSEQGWRGAAAKSYAMAIQLAPAHGVAYNNLAALVAASGRRAEALHLYLVSHSLQPQAFATYPQMHLNVAGQLVDAAQYDEALHHYERGLAFATHADDTLARIIHLRQRVCDWRGLEASWPGVLHEVRRALRRTARPPRRPVLPPMHAATLPLSPAELLGLAQAHAAGIATEAHAVGLCGFERAVPPLPLLPPPETGGSGDGGALRVGLLSSDVKRHPVSILLAEPLGWIRRHLPRLRISLFVLNQPDAEGDGGGAGARDEWGRAMRGAAAEAHDLSGLCDAEAAAAINAAHVHRRVARDVIAHAKARG